MSYLFRWIVIAFLLVLFCYGCHIITTMADEDYQNCIEAGKMSEETCYRYAYY